MFQSKMSFKIIDGICALTDLNRSETLCHKNTCKKKIIYLSDHTIFIQLTYYSMLTLA